ncbi:MAG: NAD(P)H-hydrate epimerase, partial [Propylenella sp.]
MTPIELLTPDEMATADRLTIAGGLGGFHLMQNAGEAVADGAGELVPRGDVLVLAGPGNNGGDGFAAAALLRRRARGVRVALLGRERLSGDAARAASAYDGPLEMLGPETGFSAALVIDALFGAGLARALSGAAADAVERLNGAGLPVLAVDLPSGVDGRTGAIQGVAVRATRTITFFRLKPGHLLLPGRLHCGPTAVAQIGIPESVLREIRPSAFHNLPPLWRGSLRPPRPDDHKYTRGHAFVVSGPA